MVITGKMFLSDVELLRGQQPRVLAAASGQDLVGHQDQGVCEPSGILKQVQKNHGDATASNCSTPSGISSALQFFP